MGNGLGTESVGNKALLRTVLLTSADENLRARLRQELTAMRWQVREAAGGAEAMELLEAQGAEAMVLDSVLPDLEVNEFAGEICKRHPVMDLLRIDGSVSETEAHSLAETSCCTRCDGRRRLHPGPAWAMGQRGSWHRWRCRRPPQPDVWRQG